MLIYNDIYNWNGWGGAFRLGSGKCRLKIWDLKRHDGGGLSFLKHFLVVATDLPREKPGDMTVKSCSSHIATSVAKQFAIDPGRMQFVEYYPARTYGRQDEHLIEERFDAVDFTWHDDKAIDPSYRPLEGPLVEILKQLMPAAR